MNYDELSDFIENRMSMSHIYQPVMLLALLKNGGICSERQIAKEILSHDESQIEYYTQITNNMVGRVLRKHNIVNRDKQTKTYQLQDYDNLTPEQSIELIHLCENRLYEFLKSRGLSIFEHRRKSSGPISDSIKFKVLKRAKYHCELCGISADKKALEVDHIIPRNQGGSNDISNLQTLCYSCNSMKQDKDDTDFRAVRESYNFRKSDCVFCNIDSDRIIDSNELAYVIRDGYPVTELHSLIITKRHVTSYFDLGQAELNAYNQLIDEVKNQISSMDVSVDGFNIGVNDGEVAGQTIFHCHIHIIPRRKGDVEDPRGGVRHLIPGKGNY